TEFAELQVRVVRGFRRFVHAGKNAARTTAGTTATAIFFGRSGSRRRRGNGSGGTTRHAGNDGFHDGSDGFGIESFHEILSGFKGSGRSAHFEKRCGWNAHAP